MDPVELQLLGDPVIPLGASTIETDSHEYHNAEWMRSLIIRIAI
jgi:hypothetical protein